MSFDPEVFEKLREAYLVKTIPVYYERYNSGRGRSLALGMLSRRNYGVGWSRQNDKFGHIWDEAKSLSKILCPDLDWTTLAINYNYQATPHIDRNNDGESCVCGFGDYTGGELVLTDTGEQINIRHNPFFFEAAKTRHHVKPILSGTRLSIVFFRPKFNQFFRAKYGKPSLAEMEALMPPRPEGVSWSAVQIPV
jgi:hypothetical protein